MLKGLNSKNITFQKFGKNVPAVMLHSGGTSGKPKNVVLQNRAFVMAAIQEGRVFSGMNVGDSVIVTYEQNNPSKVLKLTKKK